MKIALLATDQSFTSKELAQAAKKRGHRFDRFTVSTLELGNLERDTTVKRLLTYDIVYPRTGVEQMTRSFLGALLMKHGVRFINQGYIRQPGLVDKTYQTRIAKTLGLTIPKTLTARSYSSTLFSSVSKSLGLPFVTKIPEAALGKGVFLIKNKSDFTTLNRLPEEEPLLFQKLIPNTGDYRIFVVGRKVVGIYKRVPADGMFKANISQGGHGEPVTDKRLRDALSKISLAVTKKLQLEIAGVDIMKSERDGKLYFIECNNIPNWKGLQETTGINVAEMIIAYFETLRRS